MSRYAPITDPEAKVNVNATVTQKMRSDLQTLAFAKEHCSVKDLFTSLIQRYLEANTEFLRTLADLREEAAVSENEVVAVN